MVTLNEPVPNVRLALTSGLTRELKDFRGQKVVLYFYPKDNTPGCTQESIHFAEHHAEFQKLNTVILGVSRDSLNSHERFKIQCTLPFELVSDTGSELCKLFDVLKEKSLYGKRYVGIERSTFLIDGSGILRKEWRNVKVPGHVDAVREAVKSL